MTSTIRISKLYLFWVLITSITLLSTSCACPSTPTPTSPSTHSESQNEVEVKDDKTGDTGQVTFIDNSTGEQVNIKVVDDSNHSPLSNIEVTYYDGEGYEVFTTYDASNEYLPAIGIYEHNSDHVIETKRAGRGSYQIFVFEDEGTQKAAWKWEHDNHMEWYLYSYDRTIDYEEKLGIQKWLGKLNDFLFKGILYFFSASSPISPSDIVEHFAPEPENPPQRWDIYDRSGKDYGGGLGFTILPSNIPEVEISYLTVNGNEVSASWIGSDKDTYEVRVPMPSNKDLTKYVDGNDTSDLKYSYRITKNGQAYDTYDWTEYSSDRSTKLDILERGSYKFEVRVRDEVDNLGMTTRDFEIKSEPEPIPNDCLPLLDRPLDIAKARTSIRLDTTTVRIGKTLSIEAELEYLGPLSPILGIPHLGIYDESRALIAEWEVDHNHSLVKHCEDFCISVGDRFTMHIAWDLKNWRGEYVPPGQYEMWTGIISYTNVEKGSRVILNSTPSVYFNVVGGEGGSGSD